MSLPETDEHNEAGKPRGSTVALAFFPDCRWNWRSSSCGCYCPSSFLGNHEIAEMSGRVCEKYSAVTLFAKWAN